MSYLICKCVSETMRKYPALSYVSRVCVKDYQVSDSNLFVEKGTQIFVPIRAIHYDAEYHEDPEKFNPNRFSEENVKHMNPYTHMPFGEGPRMCIGMEVQQIFFILYCNKL